MSESVLTVDMRLSDWMRSLENVSSEITFVLPGKVAERHGIDVTMVRERDDQGEWHMRIYYTERDPCSSQ